PATEHARLSLARVVEDAGLPRRNALLAVDQLDLVMAVSAAQPCRLWRPRRANLDVDFTTRGNRRVNVAVAEPVDVAQHDAAGAQRLARADHHAAALGVEPHDIERRAGGNAEAFALADGEIDDAGMRAEHLAVAIDDDPGFGGAGLESLDHVGVTARRHKADVLTVVLVGDRQSERAR